MSYPKIYIQVPTPAEFPVADLEGHCHLIVLVQRFVKALPRVRLELDVVGMAEGEEGEEGKEEAEKVRHGGRSSVKQSESCQEVKSSMSRAKAGAVSFLSRVFGEWKRRMDPGSSVGLAGRGDSWVARLHLCFHLSLTVDNILKIISRSH